MHRTQKLQRIYGYRHSHIPLASSTIIIVHSVDMHNIRAQAMKRVNDSSGKCVFVSRLGIFFPSSAAAAAAVLFCFYRLFQDYTRSRRRYCVLAYHSFVHLQQMEKRSGSEHVFGVQNFPRRKTLFGLLFITSTCFCFYSCVRV